MDLFDLFGEQKALVKDILKNPYHLIDLTQVADEDLKKYLWFGTMALTAKHIHDKDIFPFLESLLKAFKIIAESGEYSYIYTVISYIAEAGRVSDEQKFKKILTTGLESVKEGKLMTFAKLFEPEIFEEARQKALQEAMTVIEQSKQEAMTVIEQSKQETLHNVALNLLMLKVDVGKIHEATGLSIEDIETLKKQIH
jgi:hypothetical protein